ncbi:hypothetical protein Tco_0179093 [Tanacetum coccineum]
MTPKEILATEGANFPKPPPMRTLEEQRVGNGTRKTKQKVSQKFSHGSASLFPRLTATTQCGSHVTIEKNARVTTIHRMYNELRDQCRHTVRTLHPKTGALK